MGSAIVIGTGVIGAATALALARAGWIVTSVDRNAMAGHGSTSASSGVIRMHYSTREGTALSWEGQHHWADWAGYLGLPDGTALAPFRKVGCLVMKHASNGDLRRNMEHSEALGIPFEVWEPETIRKRLAQPDLRCFWPPRRPDHGAFGMPTGGNIAGGVFWPDAGYVSDPALAAQNLLAAAAARGAQIVRGEVTGILRDTRVRGLHLADGRELRADVVVNVGGPASSRLNRMAGVAAGMAVTTRPQRMETAYLPGPPDFDMARDGIVVSDADIGCYAKPDVGGGVSVGTEGPACDTPDWIEGDTTERDTVGEQAEVQAMRYAQRIPTVPLPRRMAGAVGIYDVTEDWLPIYDRSDLPGFYMACGTSGNQFKNAPVAGRIMAALIAHCEGGGDHDRTPLAFTLPYTGNTIDLGHFSRLRQANPASSFSVLG
ncbi:NAD(P)/FAD-dependent oxidoreductase [Jannaschia pohangensis]|uniref:Glycine/D-amino acid oxidase n=1 Tax=Jannaschia pohangensis TaxID=390807 RepID=A0A1I3M9D8_9RHOB|nr:FAD-dependent oxidoreductase [Jannaschia pohangensis]SFI93567.1 Glycine/D-amino acid oxidase [Jannaschia pohangensis]